MKKSRYSAKVASSMMSHLDAKKGGRCIRQTFGPTLSQRRNELKTLLSRSLKIIDCVWPSRNGPLKAAEKKRDRLQMRALLTMKTVSSTPADIVIATVSGMDFHQSRGPAFGAITFLGPVDG